MRRIVKENGGRVAIIAAIAAVAIVCSLYILSQERLSSPLAKHYEVHAEFTNLTAVAAGFGSPVNVAGVGVGQIQAVKLKDGRAIATLRMNPGKLAHVYKDARATLVPRTPLKDMQIELKPGHPRAGVLTPAGLIPASRTQTPIDADELLAALDGDTRSYMTSLISSLGVGLHERGPDLRDLLKTLGPTSEQLRQITDLLARRRHELPRLVGDLRRLSQAGAGSDQDLRSLVQTTNQTLGALADSDRPLRQTLSGLPPTLDKARGTLGGAARLSDALAPALTQLEPTARRTRSNLRDTRELFSGGALLPIGPFKRFIAATKPLVTTLPAAQKALDAQTDAGLKSFGVLNDAVNELAYNPGGRNQGFLFWLAWFAHNVDSVVSTGDANGAVGRGVVLGSCSTFAPPGQFGQILQTVLGKQAPCPGGAPASSRKARTP